MFSSKTLSTFEVEIQVLWNIDCTASAAEGLVTFRRNRTVFTSRVKQSSWIAVKCLALLTAQYLQMFQMIIILASLWSSHPRVLRVPEGEKHYGTSKRRYLFVIRHSVTSQMT
jgi:hypothetical protein